jgi:hypothetical protein
MMTVSMKITRLPTYWTVEQAHTVIEFLEVLREQLWENHGDMIVGMLREASEDKAWQEAQGTFEFDDEIEF